MVKRTTLTVIAYFIEFFTEENLLTLFYGKYIFMFLFCELLWPKLALICVDLGSFLTQEVRITKRNYYAHLYNLVSYIMGKDATI